ncbi:hypothetical protein [uncultured Variovorax sp.]|jgi:hypothetical protein|uniref:hypothetical protein n=1 Tax=uncultured Variovorax sp. TaxID=114708 RepID=UPI0026214A28|nr:hypothetical protein [uncultured Variovorax sp.]
MHDTIEKLMAGDQAVPGHYATAHAHWKTLLQDIDTVSVEDLAKRLSSAQSWFERHCGGRWPGQEVMVWTGFASMYSTQSGWDGNEAAGTKLAKAFEASMCSIEVKGGARRAARSYHVDL